MSKLISNPFECGFADIGINYRSELCRHPKTPHMKCPNSNTFPTNCPLPDGMTYLQFVVQFVEQQKPNIVHIISKIISKRLHLGSKTNRRSRKKCKYYSIEGKCCTKPKRPFTCYGVTCGSFKNKLLSNKTNETITN